MKSLRCLLWLCGAGLFAFGCSSPKGRADIAFIGDSLTYQWRLPRVNLGTPGQNSNEMVARFPIQILGHGYSTVFILCGTNDVLQHIDTQTSVINLGHMVDIAQENHIEPVLAEIPPVFKDDGAYLPAVDALNAKIVLLANARHVKLVDFHKAFVGHPEYESDGVHIRRRGYMMMDIALVKTINPF